MSAETAPSAESDHQEKLAAVPTPAASRDRGPCQSQLHYMVGASREAQLSNRDVLT